MRRGLRRAASGWPAVVLCSLVVLLGGSRLVALSMQQHAAQTRVAAQRLAEHTARALTAQLQALGDLAGRHVAERAHSGADTAAARAPLASPHSFWITSDGTVRGEVASDRGAVEAIGAELKAAPMDGAGTTLIGPIRYGSRWLIAERARATPNAAGAGSRQAAWVIVYQDLETLLVAAHLDQAVPSGYDFQLSRFDPASGRDLAVFASSATGPLLAPARSPVVLPPTSTLRSTSPTDAGASWSLAIAPRAGWFPVEELIVDVSLLLLLTWLIALGVHDGTRHVAHLRTALAVSRKRLQSTQQSLSREVELRQSLQRSFEHAHSHDSFTGLPNRHYFLGQLDRALRDMRTRSGYKVIVLLIAVDRFKIITDTLGHTAGDELMVQVTRLLDQALAGNEHILARWADDELALLLADANRMPQLSEAVQALQQELESPLVLRRHRVMIATHIGATRVESGLARPEEVMREADVALTSARTPGGSNLVTYSADMQNQFMQVVSLEGDLHRALEREEFRLRFQPIVDISAGRIVGVEALLRWMHPLEGLLPPARFLSFAEEAGLIVPITRWIISRAGKLAAHWQSRLPGRRFFISINLSPAALLDPGLSEHVAQTLRETAISPDALKFELTENGLISNVGAARDVLDRLHAMGIELMLDDFGTGYSSLSHLQLFPFSFVKLDGPVGRRLGSAASEVDDDALMRAMAQMAATLGLKTIAEIVETSAAVEALQQIGCQFAQGNAFCAPVEADQALQRLITNCLEPIDQAESESDSPTLILPVLAEPAMH